VNDGFLSKRDGLSAGSSHHKHRQSVERMMAKRKKSARSDDTAIVEGLAQRIVNH
jgi:hypothetical protein